MIIIGGILLVGAAIGLALLAGGGPGGQSPLASDGDDGTLAGADTTTPGGTSGSGSGAGSSGQSLASLVANGETESEAPSSLTMYVNSSASDHSGTYVENRTIRVDRAADRFRITRRQVFDASGTLTLETAVFGTNETVYVRSKSLGPNGSVTYDRRNRTDEVTPVNASSFRRLFEFEHERTDGGDHRFTADSVTQYTGPRPSNGTLAAVSALVVVDEETGLITRARFRIVADRDGETVTKRTSVSVTAIGQTTVSAPDWLPVARNRTGR